VVLPFYVCEGKNEIKGADEDVNVL
jgi:hypothetical protein